MNKYLIVVLVTVLAATSMGCISRKATVGAVFTDFKPVLGQTSRTEVLKTLGPPMLFDFTKAGDIGTNYLVYEVRRSKAWAVNPIFFGFVGNNEKTDTMLFYFDDQGLLTSFGSTKEQPTTKREGFVLGGSWMLQEIVK